MKEKRDLQSEPTPMMLINRVSKGFLDLMRHAGERKHVPDRYREFLRVLSHRDGRTQAELASCLGQSAPSVSATLRSMQQDGYIRRETDMIDQRITRVYLTEQGRAVNHEMKICADGYDRRIMVGITEEEYTIVLRVLQQMRENVIRVKKEDFGK